MCFTIELIALLGLGVSLYAYWIEHKLSQNANYKAVCDISDKISCTKSLAGPYSAIIGISNTIIGIIFYTSMFWLAIGNYNKLLFIGAASSIIVSVYLAYILTFKVKTFCLVCFCIYIVNILLLIATLSNLYQ